MTNSRIHMNVMRRVRTIHALRASATGVGVSFVILAASLYVLGREVWVARVFENMPQVTHITALAKFLVSAFTTTDMIVQALTLLTLIALAWMVREVGRILTLPRARFA